MIRIDKGDAPDVLKTTGVEAAKALCDAFDAGEKLVIKTSIYGHQAVRDALEASHHRKCAFCEVVIPKPYAVAHVEHWRPKGRVKQENGDTATVPGYYWLAYEWDNLLLACQFCNSSNKGTQFPLVDPSRRVLDHHQDLAAEDPQLLKPDAEDPSGHIAFVDELPRGVTERGRTTVRVLGLDRLEHRPRDQLLADLRDIRTFVLRNNEDPHPEIRALVSAQRVLYERSVLPSSPFSAMASAFVATNPLPGPFAFISQ
jgi:uncharacterized protein (TIGR02646 family)